MTHAAAHVRCNGPNGSWRAELRAQARERQAKVQDRVLRQWQAHQQRSAFAAWVAFVQERKQLRARLAGCLYRMTHRGAFEALRKWRGFVAAERARAANQQQQQLMQALQRQRAAGKRLGSVVCALLD